MGGFFSTYLLNQFGGKAVLINPAVTPHILLADYLGEHENPYTKESFILETKHMIMLENLLVEPIQDPSKFWVLVQTGDETLDYRQATNKYQGAKMTIEPGGDHSFVGYDSYLADIAEFLLSD
jgi:predicted esterase YcpF (UPF0227 family)